MVFDDIRNTTETNTEQEWWDLIDAEGRNLGIRIRKGGSHSAGTYHLVIGVWVIAADGRALITKRSEDEVQFPGLWENTGGCAVAGEGARDCAVRELKEETGINAEAGQFVLLGTLTEKTALVKIFGLSMKTVPDQLRLQPGETADAKWVTRAEWEDMIQDGCVSGAALRRMRAAEAQLEALGFCD